jgi:tetratricopeptide (TPR) repeat protein
MKSAQHFEAGMAHFNERDYIPAIEAFTKALRYDRDNAEIWFYRGVAHRAQAENANGIAGFHQARDDLTKAIRLKPDYAEAYFHRAGVRYALDALDKEIIVDYSQAIRIQPDNAKAWYWRGMVHLAQKNDAAAIADFTEALRLQIHHSDIFLHRGIAFYRLKKYAAAKRDFEQALRLNPDEQLAKNYLKGTGGQPEG